MSLKKMTFGLFYAGNVVRRKPISPFLEGTFRATKVPLNFLFTSMTLRYLRAITFYFLQAGGDVPEERCGF